MNRIFISGLCFFVFLTGCQQTELYEKRVVIQGSSWSSKDPVKGEILVTDTSAWYNLYICIRHTDAYAYNNIWVRLKLSTGEDTLQNILLDIPLGTDASGWEGTGMNDIWDLRKKIRGHFPFKHAGKYHYEITQCMREDPLKGILSAGIRLEKEK